MTPKKESRLRKPEKPKAGRRELESNRRRHGHAGHNWMESPEAAQKGRYAPESRVKRDQPDELDEMDSDISQAA